MALYRFTRYSPTCLQPENGRVQLEVSNALDSILIATDWLEGQKYASEHGKNDFKRGYLGGGLSKWAIYVSSSDWILAQVR